MADYDVVVLGGGAAGLAAARAARWEDASVALISDAPLGGDCTFTGCVPSKTLIEASRQGLDFAGGLERVARVVERIASSENADVMRGLGVDVIEGVGTFIDAKSLAVEGRDGVTRIRGQHVILATGSRPSVPPIDGIARVPYCTNETFFEPRPQPGSIVIIGAGPVGSELGEAMARFGSHVTLVDVAPRVLARYEPDASALVQAAMGQRGIDLRLGTTVKRVHFEASNPERGRFTVDLGDEMLAADEVLIAAGRSPQADNFGLAATGIETTASGYIKVDKYLKTTVDGIYAAGDCNGLQMLSHAADEMGRLAAWTALRPGRKYRYDPNRIPHAVFTSPEVAAIGVLESQAPRNAAIAEIDMQANDRALAADEPDGFVRLIARPSRLTRHKLGGKVIGATIVGGRAAEMINEVAIVMRGSGYGYRLAQTVRAYPSWSTVMQKAAARWFYDYEGSSARPPRR